jgi:hypothetical protein
MWQFIMVYWVGIIFLNGCLQAEHEIGQLKPALNYWESHAKEVIQQHEHCQSTLADLEEVRTNLNRLCRPPNSNFFQAKSELVRFFNRVLDSRSLFRTG